MNELLKQMVDDFFGKITKEELIEALKESGMGRIKDAPTEQSTFILNEYETFSPFCIESEKTKYDSSVYFVEAA